MDLAALIEKGDYEGVGKALDAMRDADRVQTIQALPGALIGKIWALAEGHPAPLDWFLPEPDKVFTYSGRNSMPVFSLFSKIFIRPKEGPAIGFNQQFWSPFSGPGYFTLEVDEGSIVFDYRKLPAKAPDAWPKIRPNKGFIPGIVYGNMVDLNRKVGERSIIGYATRGGKPLNAYYLITRNASS